jgi:uncharacterized membrane protein YidH (DUF202 family)
VSGVGSDENNRVGRGMPVERTALAWNRSALAVAAIGAVVVRIGAQSDHTAAALAAGAVLAAVAAGVWMLGQRLFAGRRAGARPSYAEQRRGLLIVTAASVASAALAVVFVIWS